MKKKSDKDFINSKFDICDLGELKSELKKEFGNNTAIDDDAYATEFISTGIDSLDYLLGGGIPCGKLSEVCGQEGVGKSSFGIHLLGQVQKTGGLGVLIDTEWGAGDRFRFQNFGVDPKKCVITVEDLAEKVFSQIEKIANFAIRKNVKTPSIIMLDSIAGLTTRAETEADMDTAQYAVTARMIKRGVQRVKLALKEANIALLCINQVREKIGGNTYVKEWVSPGGSTLSFQYIVRLFLTKGAFLGEDKKTPEGHIINTKVIKCKTSAALGRTLPIRFYYDNRGYSNCGTTYDLLNSAKFLGEGAWKTITLPDGTDKRFQSYDTFDTLYNESAENREHFNKLMKDCYSSRLNFGGTLNDDEVEVPMIQDQD